MSRILILHTGGTIGMTRTADGYSPDGQYFREAVFHMDSLKAQGMPEWELMETDPLLDSSMMNAAQWNMIGSMIRDHYADFDGFVILHGTDTMAYTASALSFMFKNLNKPVILTGSQIPLCETRSDGRDNLITSMLIAASGKVREVCIYFGGLLLRGNRAMKFSADGMQAFISPNYPPLARAGIAIQYDHAAVHRPGNGAFECRLLDDVPIGVLKVFPGIRFDLFASIITDKLKGIVIETFGSGNIPDQEGVLKPLLEKAAANGTVIVITSQCPQATVDMRTYKAGSILHQSGALSGHDMTTEAAVAKLYYLFSTSKNTDRIRFYMERDIRGELTQKDDI